MVFENENEKVAMLAVLHFAEKEVGLHSTTEAIVYQTDRATTIITLQNAVKIVRDALSEEFGEIPEYKTIGSLTV